MGTPRVAALVAIGLVAAIAAAPASAEVPDAKCEGTPSGLMGDNRVAQPFTALNTGQLVRFEAFFNDPSSAVSSTWTVQINTVDVSTDKPTNTALASTSVPVAGSGSNSGLADRWHLPQPGPGHRRGAIRIGH